MSRGIVVGQYYPVNSLVHSLDPRAKIVISMIFMVVLFVGNNFYSFAVAGTFAVLAVTLSKIPWKVLIRGLRPIVFIMLFTTALHLFLTPGPAIFQIGPLKASWPGLIQGLFIGIRLIILIVFTSLLTLTTSPIELTDGLEDILKPFSRIGVPAHEIAMMMTIALRFIPTLLEEADRIMKAQMSRGADFESGNMIQRAKSLVPLLVPLFVSAFRRADELAMAMEARCYRGGEGRTRMRQLRLSGGDYLALGLTIIMSALVIYTRIRFGPVIPRGTL
ncbi:MAG: energy-coupling factor transporter transmembrane component T [Bacillota bacterium]|nr:energy-coupling factor transporter transmembrane protein EcfT [Candidatus Fermentithermobacillaceae bacterium]HAF66625.1 transporter [Clostridiales bacterium UBA9857]HOA70898.1 energy-coupling factor transporter transmembrane component T [Bacillota bacterium]HOP70345.1 energy-coupling factor transporter transmembrane component T [Bacillota bacterium]HPT35551.1 energy-coupling factor transporter transmembrane component T [Bacillota bacterium]